MSKQRMIVTDSQLLIDMDLLFNAIRDSQGNWQQVEVELKSYRDAVAGMATTAPSVADTEPQQRMVVTDDQLIIDSDLVFNAIREAEGNWQQVETEMHAYLQSVKNMCG